MHWILQSNIYNEDALEEMKILLTRMSISWSEHKLIPFVRELDPSPNLSHTNVICFGTYAMRHVAIKNSWNPGVFDLESLTYQNCIDHWHQNMLNSDSVFCSIRDSIHHVTGLRFVRPVTDTKSFARILFDKTQFEKFHMEIMRGEDSGNFLTAQTPIMISKPKKNSPRI